MSLIDSTELRRRIRDNHLAYYQPTDGGAHAITAVLATVDDMEAESEANRLTQLEADQLLKDTNGEQSDEPN